MLSKRDHLRWIISLSSSRPNIIPLILSARESNKGLSCGRLWVCQFDDACDLTHVLSNRWLEGYSSSDERSELSSVHQPSKPSKVSVVGASEATGVFEEVPSGKSPRSAGILSRISELHSLIDGMGWVGRRENLSFHVSKDTSYT